jgi:lysophospholipase L1-like esterase
MTSLFPSRLRFGALTFVVLLGAACWSQALADSPATTQAAVKPARPRKQPDAGWEKDHAAFAARAKEGNVDLLFVGDSITRGWRGAQDAWDKTFGPWKPVNFGIGGDRTEHVLYRLQNGELDGVSPKAIVLLIGTNNSAVGDKPEDIAAGVQAILRTVHEKCPKARVLLLSILPRGADAGDPKRQSNQQTNALLAKLDDGGKTVRFLDVTGRFMAADGAIIKDAYGADLLHLTHKGYEMMAQAIGPVVKEMMEGK